MLVRPPADDSGMSDKRLHTIESPDNATTAVDDRRSEPRYGSAKTVAICPSLSPAISAPALVMDVSAHGIGLITQICLNGGDEFSVKLDGAIAQYTVRYCRECDGGRYRIGASLTAGDGGAIVESLRSA
jgi:hypothetical protein